MVVYEIPLSPKPQSLAVIFPNGKTYNLRLIYMFTPLDCWELDINDAAGNPLVLGIALVTGADLLAQYRYLGLGAALYAATDADVNAIPRFWNLGVSSHLYLAA